jgi:hypothetical protein
MQRVEPGRYRAGGGQLGLAGAHRVEVVVHRTGARDSTAAFPWSVPTPAPARRVVLSNHPLEPLLSVAALVVGALVLAAAGLAWSRSAPGIPARVPLVATRRVRREA